MNEESLWEMSKANVLDGTSLFSRGPRVSPDIAPKYAVSAKGCTFTTLDGQEFLDYGMGVGSVFLGYGVLKDAITDQIAKGNNLSLLSPLQVELSEKLKKNIPSCEKVKFTTTGSEATESVVRVARAYTERDKIVYDHYHGWMSWCAPRKSGIPKCYSDLNIQHQDSDLEKYKVLLEKDDIAGVIVEPCRPSNGTRDNRARFLNSLKRLCYRHGTLLLFDEVACGYRFGLGGGQTFFGVTPDVSAFGKSISNGYPLSFFCCLDKIANTIEDKIFVSSTYGGNALSLRAGLETVNFLEENKNIQSLGAKLKEGVNATIDAYGLSDYVKIIGFPQRLDWKFKNDEVKTLVLQEFIKKKIFFAWEIKNSCAHHTVETLRLLSALRFILDDMGPKLKNPKKYIQGEVMRSIL